MPARPVGLAARVVQLFEYGQGPLIVDESAHGDWWNRSTFFTARLMHSDSAAIATTAGANRSRTPAETANGLTLTSHFRAFVGSGGQSAYDCLGQQPRVAAAAPVVPDRRDAGAPDLGQLFGDQRRQWRRLRPDGTAPARRFRPTQLNAVGRRSGTWLSRFLRPTIA